MKQKIRQIVPFLLICFLGISTVKVQAAVSEDNKQVAYAFTKGNFTVTVNYGIAQQARYGRYTNMQISVQNTGDTFRGSSIITLINQEQDGIRYIQDLVLEPDSEIVLNQMISISQYITKVKLSLVDEHGKTVVENMIPWNVKNYANNYCFGVLSKNPLCLQYFEYFGSNVLTIDESQLKNDYLSLDMLDAIVVNDFDLDTLPINRLQTILQYVSHGGNLILGAGEAYLSNIELLKQYDVFRLASPIQYSKKDIIPMNLSVDSSADTTELLTAIKDYEIIYKQNLQQLESSETLTDDMRRRLYLGKSMLGNLPITDVKSDIIEKDITSFRIENTISQKNYQNTNVFEIVGYGQGRVLIYHFDLANNEINQEKLQLYEGCKDGLFSLFYAELVYEVKSNLSKVTYNRMEKEASQRVEDYRIQDIAEFQSERKAPRIGGLIIVYITYLVFIGPTVFIILWKVKKHGRVWIVIPVLSIVFLVIVMLMGSQTRVRTPYAGVLNIEYFDEKEKMMNGESYAFVFLHKHSPVSVKFDTTNAMRVGLWQVPNYYEELYNKEVEVGYNYGESSIDIYLTSDGTRAELNNQPAFAGQMFEGEYQREYDPVVQSNLKIGQNSIYGQITNVSGQELIHTFVCYNGYYILLGNLKVGQTVDLSDCPTFYCTSMDELLYTSNVISDSFHLNMNRLSNDNIRLIDAYSYTYEQYIAGNQEPYLIAQSEEIPKESAFYGIAQKEYSYRNTIQVIKLDVPNELPNQRQVANMDIYLKKDSAYSWDQKTRYAYLNTLDFEYRIPNGFELKKIYLSDMFFNQQQNEAFSLNGCSRVYFYDFSSKQYELVFDLESEYAMRAIKGESLEKFINQENQVLVRYENRSTVDGYIVPVLSCIEEVRDARD